MSILSFLGKQARARRAEKWGGLRGEARIGAERLEKEQWREKVSKVFRGEEDFDFEAVEDIEDIELLVDGFLAQNKEAVAAARSRNTTTYLQRIRDNTILVFEESGLTPAQAARFYETGSLDDLPDALRLELTESGALDMLVETRRMALYDAEQTTQKLATGVVPDDVVEKDLAQEIGLTVEDIIKRKEGGVWNPETMVRAHIIMARMNEAIRQKVQALPRTAQGIVDLGAVSEAEKVTLLRAAHIAAAINMQVRGAVSEAGRVLRSVATARRAGRGSADAMLQGQTSDIRVSPAMAEMNGYGLDAATPELQLQNLITIAEQRPSMIGKQLADNVRVGGDDMALRLMYGNLLGSAATHSLNILGNFTIGVIENLIHWHAGAVGAIERMGTGPFIKRYGAEGGVDPLTKVPYGPNDGEAWNAGLVQLIMVMKTIPEAMSMAAWSLRKRRSPEVFNLKPGGGQRTDPQAGEKFGHTEGVITLNNLHKLQRQYTGIGPETIQENAGTKVADAVLDYSSGYSIIGLGAEDAAYKVLWYRSKVFALAMNEGRGHGLSGKELRAYVRNIEHDPMSQAPHIHTQAVEWSQYGTLTEAPGQFGEKLYELLYQWKNAEGKSARFGRVLGKIVMPFFTILNNATKYLVHLSSPAHLLQLGATGAGRMVQSWKRLRTGKMPEDAPYAFGKVARGLSHPNPAIRDYYAGKVLVGIELMALTTWLAYEGMILGGEDVRAYVDRAKAEKRRIRYTPGEGEYLLVIPWTLLDPEGQWKGTLHDGKDMAYHIDRYEPLGGIVAQGASWANYLYTVQEEGGLSAEAFDMLFASSLAIGEKMLDQGWALGALDWVNALQGKHSDDRPGQRVPQVARLLAKSGHTFTPIFGSGALRPIAKGKDVVVDPIFVDPVHPRRGTRVPSSRLVDDGKGHKVLRPRPTDAPDIFGLIRDNWNMGMQKADAPWTEGRAALALQPNQMGGSLQEPAHLGPGGAYWNHIKIEPRPYDLGPLVEQGVFTEEEVTRPVGLRKLKFGKPPDFFLGIPNVPQADLDTAATEAVRWRKFIDLTNPYAEYERLAWGPPEWPRYISNGVGQIELTDAQYYDYVQLLTGFPDKTGIPELWEKRVGTAMPILTPEGETWWGFQKKHMRSEDYQRRGDSVGAPGTSIDPHSKPGQIQRWRRLFIGERGDKFNERTMGLHGFPTQAARALAVKYPDLVVQSDAIKADAVRQEIREGKLPMAGGRRVLTEGGEDSSLLDDMMSGVQDAYNYFSELVSGK